MKSIVLEAGINHFGNLDEVNVILNYFLKSNLKYLTYLTHTEDFYAFQKKKGRIYLDDKHAFYFDE
tara:strand:- start:404 stop:601 length:198 start_codon:yes stop_codon:yes gene_type:complete